MTTKTNKWSDLSVQDFAGFIELVSDVTLDKVFYPVPVEKPGMGLYGNLLGCSAHPLHPHFNPPMQRVGGGLLDIEGGPLRFEALFIDYEGERLTQGERIFKHWQAIKLNKIFRPLNADANFKKAKTVFEQKSAVVKNGNLYAHAFAGFRFLEAVASTVGIFLVTDGKAFNWPTPDKRAIGKARGHAWAMLDAFDKDGIKLPDYQKQFILKDLLSKLADQLDVQYKLGRAAWGGKNRPYRVLIQSLANALRRHFGEASPEIVLSLSAMVGCPFTEKTINNQLNEAIYRQALAKALLSPGNNSSKFG